MRRIIHQHLRKSRKQKDIYHVLMKGVNDEMEGYKFAIQEINLLIRFSSNPVRFSLAASLAFLYESRLSERRRHITAAKTKAEISIHFAEQATKMLGHVVYGETNKMERLDELLLNAEDDFSSIAMAVELENFSFLSHPLIINYVKRRWVGDADKIGRYGFQFIEVNTLIESVKNSYDMSIGSTQQQQSSFVILNSMRAFSNQIISNFDETIVGMLDPMVLINSPSTRFKVEFVFFGCRVAVQQFVLSYEEYAPGNQVLGSFGPLDMVHFGIGIGFLMAEIAEVQKAYRWGSIHIDRYWGDGWNQMDWCIQIVFFSFWALKIVSQYYDTNSDYDEAALYHGYSLDVLGINSIVLWIRMLEHFTIFPSLGPLVRIMGLMLMDMFNFSIIFAFMIFGFASAFSMWFRDSVDSYSTLIKATVTLFSASLGEFDYEAFEGTEKQARGQICLTIFLGVSTVLLLNLLIAILSHRYEATQIQSYEEYHLGMAKNFLALRWETAEILKSGVPLPSALNAFRVLTYPLRWIFGVEVEKVMNLGFLVTVSSIFLSVCLLLYVIVFVISGTFTTFMAGFFFLLDFWVIMFKTRIKAGKGKKRNFFVSVIRITFWVVFLPFNLAGVWCYILLVRYPYYVFVGGFMTLSENINLMQIVMKDQKHKLMTKREKKLQNMNDSGRSLRGYFSTRGMSGIFGNKGKNDEKENENKLQGKEESGDWVAIAEEAMEEAKFGEIISFEKLLKIMEKNKVLPAAYQWVNIRRSMSLTSKMSDATSPNRKSFDHSKMRKNSGSMFASNSFNDDFEEEGGGGEYDDLPTVEPHIEEAFEVRVHHAFFYSEHRVESGNEGGEQEEEDVDDGDDNFNILYKDFCYFMRGGKKSVFDDPSDACPLIRPKTVYLITKDGGDDEESDDELFEEEIEEEEEEEEEEEKERVETGEGSSGNSSGGGSEILATQLEEIAKNLRMGGGVDSSSIATTANAAPAPAVRKKRPSIYKQLELKLQLPQSNSFSGNVIRRTSTDGEEAKERKLRELKGQTKKLKIEHFKHMMKTKLPSMMEADSDPDVYL